MPVNTYVLSPGKLLIGSVGSQVDYAAQNVACTVKVAKKKTDDVPVLSGDVIPGDTTYSYTLEVEFYQDLAATSGIVQFSWANAGQNSTFTFVPNTAAAKSVKGILTIDPIDIGGDKMKTKPTSKASFDIVGTPVLGSGVAFASAEEFAEGVADPTGFLASTAATPAPKKSPPKKTPPKNTAGPIPPHPDLP